MRCAWWKAVRLSLLGPVPPGWPWRGRRRPRLGRSRTSARGRACRHVPGRGRAPGCRGSPRPGSGRAAATARQPPARLRRPPADQAAAGRRWAAAGPSRPPSPPGVPQPREPCRRRAGMAASRTQHPAGTLGQAPRHHAARLRRRTARTASTLAVLVVILSSSPSRPLSPWRPAIAGPRPGCADSACAGLRCFRVACCPRMLCPMPGGPDMRRRPQRGTPPSAAAQRLPVSAPSLPWPVRSTVHAKSRLVWLTRPVARQAGVPVAPSALGRIPAQAGREPVLADIRPSGWSRTPARCWTSNAGLGQP